MHLYRSDIFWKAPWKSSCVSVSTSLSAYISLSLCLSLCLSICSYLPLFSYLSILSIFSYYIRESPRDVVAYVLNCDIIVSKFELQSRYFVHFRTNTLDSSHCGLNNSTKVFLQEWLWHSITSEWWYTIERKSNRNYIIKHAYIHTYIHTYIYIYIYIYIYKCVCVCVLSSTDWQFRRITTF